MMCQNFHETFTLSALQEKSGRNGLLCKIRKGLLQEPRQGLASLPTTTTVNMTTQENASQDSTALPRLGE
jgi:hypothetical protein